MAESTSKKGKRGEDEAVRLLESAGFSVITRNFRAKSGEIDIIADDHGTLVFIEVKAWHTLGLESLEHAVDQRKQKKIVETAKFFLENYREYSNKQIRFDVVFIGQGFTKHLASAFMESV